MPNVIFKIRVANSLCLAMILYINTTKIKTRDMTNLYDIITYSMVIVSIISEVIVVDEYTIDHPILRLCYTIALFLVWSRIILFLRGYKKLGLMIRLLK